MSPGYDPISLIPWTARKLLWNPEPLGAFFGEVCMEVWQRNPNDFGREVMDILEEKLGCYKLSEGLSAPIKNEPQIKKLEVKF